MAVFYHTFTSSLFQPVARRFSPFFLSTSFRSFFLHFFLRLLNEITIVRKGPLQKGSNLAELDAGNAYGSNHGRVVCHMTERFPGQFMKVLSNLINPDRHQILQNYECGLLLAASPVRLALIPSCLDSKRQ